MMTCRYVLPGQRFLERLWAGLHVVGSGPSGRADDARPRVGGPSVAGRRPGSLDAGRRATIALALCVVAGGAALLSAPAARADGEPQPTLPIVQLQVGGVPLSTEIASSGEQRYMGLSFREALGDNAGMLFVYPEERPLTFTMRNTRLPLSIAFVSDELIIEEIVDMDVGPGQLFPSERPARYALEVNQGWFERNGVAPGDVISMP